MGPRREYAAALLLVAGGSALALAVAQATWVRLTVGSVVREPGAGPTTSIRVLYDVKGSSAAGFLVALALVGLAGALGVVATRGVVRRAVGCLLALVGLGLAFDALRVLVAPRGSVAAAAAQSSIDAGTLDAASVSVVAAWPLLAVAGGLLVVAGGVLTVVHGGRWAVMSARYDRPAGSAGSRPGDAWAALDRGDDPTLDPPAPATGTDSPTDNPTDSPTNTSAGDLP